MTERLYRSPTDRVIAGVAGGMAVWLNVDPSLVRLGWVLLAIFSGGLFVLAYVVLMIVVPLPPAGWIPRAAAPGGPPAAGPAWGPPSPPDPTAWPAPDPSDWPAAASPEAPPAGGTPPWPAPARQPAPASPPRPGNAGIVAGVALVLLGAWFLVDDYLRVDWDLLWPGVVIVIGALLIALAIRDRR